MMAELVAFSFTVLTIVGLQWRSTKLETSSATSAEKERLEGGCHCKRVRWQVTTPMRLVVWVCNCSICQMKRNDHVVVPKESFKLLAGQDDLTTYTFNTGVAKHIFCKHCGVQSFYRPRSNPDGVGITFTCIDDYQIRPHRFDFFNGEKWEEFIAKSGIARYSES